MLFGDRPQNELKKKIDSIKKSIDTLYLNILEIEEGLDIFDAIRLVSPKIIFKLTN